MKFVFILIILLGANIYKAIDDVDVLRKLLILSNKNLEYARQFKINTDKISTLDNPTIIGYKAMSYFMLSKHLINPYYKLDNFKKGKYYIDKAISLDSNNIELIFLRYCVQINVPRVLKYSSNITKDKIKILAYLNENKNTQNLNNEILDNIKLTLTK